MKMFQFMEILMCQLLMDIEVLIFKILNVFAKNIL